jgi:hypothetical protein
LLTLEAAAALRELIEQVVLTPDAEAADGLRVELHGDLAVLLAFSAVEAPPRRQAVRSGRDTPNHLFGAVDYRWLRGQDLNL